MVVGCVTFSKTIIISLNVVGSECLLLIQSEVFTKSTHALYYMQDVFISWLMLTILHTVLLLLI